MDEQINILVVDDNQPNLKVVSSSLKIEGYNIALALDGTSALKVLDDNKIDLILLDIMMPGIDGFEVCRRIKQNEKLKDIPVIFLTAKNQTEDVVEGFKAGGVDYITKPFNRAELLIRVNNHLELSRSRKKILEMNRTRDKLYSIIAHDISSPLSGIAVTISSINSGHLDTSGDDFKQIMLHLDKSTRETLTLLDNLLEWTRVQGGAIRMNPQDTHLYPVVADCLQLLKGNATNKNITIELNVAEDAEAFFDEVTIHTVFRNIISNAIKFTPDNGEIFIDSEDFGDFLAISVKDTGTGMSENKIQKIFEKNEHYTSPGTKSEQGSGLGLFIVKDFVNQNKGEIKVVSTVGQGTTISVYLPASKMSKEKK